MRTWWSAGAPPQGCEGGNGKMVVCPNLVNNLPLLESLGYPETAMQPFSDLSLTTNYSDYVSWVSELQLKSTSDSDLQWITGLFLMQEDNEIRFDVEDPFCCGIVIPLAQSFVQPERIVESAAVMPSLTTSTRKAELRWRCLPMTRKRMSVVVTSNQWLPSAKYWSLRSSLYRDRSPSFNYETGPDWHPDFCSRSLPG